MEIEVVTQQTNPLLRRLEVKFRVRHDEKGTPKREDVRDMLSAKFKTDKERLVVNYLRSEFGRRVTAGCARLYDTKELLLKTEPEHILVRNRFKENVAKVKKEKAPPHKPKGEAAKPEEAKPKDTKEK